MRVYVVKPECDGGPGGTSGGPPIGVWLDKATAEAKSTYGVAVYAVPAPDLEVACLKMLSLLANAPWECDHAGIDGTGNRVNKAIEILYGILGRRPMESGE